MINLGHNAQQAKDFIYALHHGYYLRNIVQVLTLDHKYVATITESNLLDGQVDIDSDDEKTRSANLSVFDPNGALGFDTGSPVDGSMYLDRMIRIVQSYSYYVKGKVVVTDVPIFCGPVVAAPRDNVILTINAVGKEALHMAPYSSASSGKYGKGAEVYDTVEKMLREKGGETKFNIPNNDKLKLGRDYILTDESFVWPTALSMVGARLRNHLFYDGRGYAVLRATPTAPVFTFDETMLTSVPKLSFDSTDTYNTVKVKGGTPKGKSQIIYKMSVPSSVAASAQHLKMGGINKPRLKVIEDTTIDNMDDAKALAKREVDSMAMQNVTVTFESVVIPHLEPEDIYSIKTRSFSGNQRVKQITIPLKAGTMSVNFSTKKSVNYGKIR